MSDSKHTLGPLTLKQGAAGNIYIMSDPSLGQAVEPHVATVIFRTAYDYAALAEFIVKACNVHDELLAALKEIIAPESRNNIGSGMCEKAKAAIAKAEGE